MVRLVAEPAHAPYVRPKVSVTTRLLSMARVDPRATVGRAVGCRPAWTLTHQARAIRNRLVQAGLMSEGEPRSYPG